MIQEIGRTVGNLGGSRKNRETWTIWLYRNYGMVAILLFFFVAIIILHQNYIKKNAANLMKDGFLLADSKSEVYQERVLLL